jgi:hypothetical protein
MARHFSKVPAKDMPSGGSVAVAYGLMFGISSLIIVLT